MFRNGCCVNMKDSNRVSLLLLKILHLGSFSTCISSTSLLYFDSLRSMCRLKAQQTPESVTTGVKISEQLTSLPCKEQIVIPDIPLF